MSSLHRQGQTGSTRGKDLGYEAGVLPEKAREEWAWDSGEWPSHLRVGIGHY